MTVQPADVYELVRKIRYDATAIQGKVTDLLAMLADLNLSEQPAARCPECGLETRGPRTLAEHRYVSHDGPTPEHWFDPDGKESLVNRDRRDKGFLVAFSSKAKEPQ